jgi:hypothetical protein
MATLVLKNTTASQITINDASGVIVPASPGSESFTDARLLLQLASSLTLRGLISAGSIIVNNGTSDLIVSVAFQYLSQLQVQAGFDALPMTGALYQFQVGSQLDAAPLPLSRCGLEIAQAGITLTTFRARRGTPGTSGTTTIQLELNGSAVSGATLSWTPGDAAFSLKSVAIAVAIVAGDQLSFLLSSAEAGAEDILAEAD